ncbi:Protein tyrosine kinase/Protein kinase domain containing protein, putative [Angomonas deanei]|uniref:Protein tyrosine kinase/Protein kinase domain containing protein, putative n=1 Tax=Angomonas deanei TaxID=59799 RepID=A0A7G2CA95_9TRYP|nr:Protein tyrosine kinase/Protein kinase domain containing protein, putative [Angomonas deanei]
MWSMLPSHPHVISFYGACKEVETNQLLLVLEYASGGSIVSMYQDFRPIPDHLFLRHAKGVALGLKHLHDHNVIHGDVKAENVLTRTDGSVAISDFGCSRLPTANSVVPSFTVRAHEAEGAPLFGTAAYMAPEVIMNESHCKSDVWAYACMLIYLWTGALPWSKVADHITCYDTIPLMFFIANEEKIPFTEEELETVPRWLQKVAARAFVRDVANRCTMTEVLTLIAEYEPITR